MRVQMKDPDAILDYAIDWSGGGYLAGQTIVSSDWTLTPVETNGVVITNQALDDATSTVTVEAGVKGHMYRLTNRIVLSNGVVDERGFALLVEERV
jgi:hypothetical protein